jgi:hypothetical protein
MKIGSVVDFLHGGKDTHFRFYRTLMTRMQATQIQTDFKTRHKIDDNLKMRE